MLVAISLSLCGLFFALLCVFVLIGSSRSFDISLYEEKGKCHLNILVFRNLSEEDIDSLCAKAEYEAPTGSMVEQIVISGNAVDDTLGERIRCALQSHYRASLPIRVHVDPS